MCVDQRTDLQKLADRQEAADGNDGKCLYSFESDTFGCPRKGFECVDEVLCVDKRSKAEKMEDEEEEAIARATWKKHVKDAAIAGIFGGILGLLMLCCCCCRCCGRFNGERCSTKAKTQRRQAMNERAAEYAIPKAIPKAIRKSKPGSPGQRDSITPLERTRAAKVAGGAVTRTPTAGGVGGASHDRNDGANEGELGHVLGGLPGGASGDGDSNTLDPPAYSVLVGQAL